MSTPPPVWQPTPQPWASAPVPAGPGPLAAWGARGGAVLLTTLWGLVATVVAGLFLAPLVAQSLDPRVPLGPVQLVGLSVLLASPARLAAGAAGAALLSLCGVTSSRLRAVPVAATGALGSWLLYLAIVTPAAGSLERALQDDRLLWELPRWVVEAAVGALLVPPGRALRERRRRTAPPRSAWGDRGAATVEYAGALTVAVTLVLALVLAATGIGQRIAQQVCRALQISCGAVEDRAVTLGVPCVLLKTERSGSANAVFAVVRVSGENGDELVVNGDGSASVKIYQGNGVGAGVAPAKLRVGPEKTGADVGAEAYAEVYGQGAYVYQFPESAGGVEAALAFLDSRRGVVGQVGDAVVPTMPWIREQYTHAEHDLSTFGDAVSTTLGLGPTAAERAAEEAAFQARTAESLELTLGARGAAEGNLEVLGSGGTAGITGDLHGTVSIPQHGGPGAATSTFTFAESGTVAASLSASPTVGGGPGPASWGAGGSAGAGVEFAVEYDGAGQPTKLTMTTQTRHESASGVTLKRSAVGKPSKGSTTKSAKPAEPGGSSAQDESPELHGSEATGTLTVTTQTLDLALPENRAAFDRVFASTTGEVDGHRYGASALRPTALLDGGALARRFALDGYDTRSEYAERSGAVGPDGKDRGADGGLGAGFADVGLEGELSSTTTELVSAVAQDHRTGGGVHPLVTCG